MLGAGRALDAAGPHPIQGKGKHIMEQHEQAVVFATASCVTEYGGRAIHVVQGEAWAADDPFVKACGDLFGLPPVVRRTGPVPRVERATRAPGEKRGPSNGR
jgi:hypothetical protein